MLADHHIRARVVGEAAYLAGVLNAARAGLGIALLAVPDDPPDGLIRVSGLPPAPPITLTARYRTGADVDAADVATGAVRGALAA